MKLRKNTSESQHRIVGSHYEASRKTSQEGSSLTSCSRQGQLWGQIGQLSAWAGLTNLEMLRDLACTIFAWLNLSCFNLCLWLSSVHCASLREVWLDHLKKLLLSGGAGISIESPQSCLLPSLNKSCGPSLFLKGRCSSFWSSWWLPCCTWREVKR